jgi:hypothetical protein
MQHFRIGIVFSIKVLILKNKTKAIMKPDKGGYWKTRKEKLLKKYTILSNKDLDFKEGQEKDMLEVLSLKLGKSDQELLKMIIAL